MFSHVTVGTSDFERAFTFYAGVMRELGLELKFCDADRAWAAWQEQRDGPLFIVGKPFNGADATSGSGQMVAFEADTRTIVDDCFTAAISAGAVNDGVPGLRPQYHEHYYGAYFRDLDGNKICICCHRPSPP